MARLPKPIRSQILEPKPAQLGAPDTPYKEPRTQSDSGKPVLRETDGAAREQARNLLTASGYGALATLEAGTGWPLASRVALALDSDGVPLILISRLAAHYGALEHDARCALLLGEVVDDEPLRHPRITVLCRALRVAPPQREAAKQQFLKRHPAAALFADFADFDFWRLLPERASLNAGFAKAYALTAQDLAAPPKRDIHAG